MAGPTKPYDETKIGDQVQKNYAFLEELFGPGHQAFRQTLWNADDATLRNTLRTRLGIDVPLTTRIMIVDIENARVKPASGDIDPNKDDFYVMVLAPVPRRATTDPTKKDYKEMQAWEGAWHHAIVDSYGM